MKYFYEKNTPGYKIGVEIKQKLYTKKIKDKKIEVFNIDKDNNILVVDSEIKFSNNDEFVYSETMAHYPLFSHPNPERILILGGGDGAILKEVLKHKRVEEVYLVENNEEIFNISNEFFPEIEVDKNKKNKKVKLSIEDEVEFLNKFEEYFDIIILDSTEKKKDSIYKAIKNSLNKDGILIKTLGAYIFNKEEISNTQKQVKVIFDNVELFRTTSFLENFYIMASKKVNIKDISLRIINIRFKQFSGKTKLKSFSPETYILSKYLPKYQQQDLK
jgi:spermidine synthase